MKNMEQQVRRLWETGILFLALVGVLAGPVQADSRGLLWKAESATATVYLVGSIHAGMSDFYPLDGAVTRAFETSSVLVVEADIRPEKQAQFLPLLMSIAVLPEGQSLRARLPDDLRALFDARVRGLDPTLVAGLDRMPPWLAAVTFDILDLQAAGLDPKQGVDLYFLNRAAASGMEIRELEGVRKQLELLAGMKPDVQGLLLKSSLMDPEGNRARLRELGVAWKAGDEAALTRILFSEFREHAELEPVKQVIFTDRNDAMSARIRDYLKSDKTVFVVVGAGHLLGDEGIVAQLRRFGNTLTRWTGE